MRKLLLATSVFALCALCAHAQTVTMVAGGGFPNNVPATASGSNVPNPQYVVVDGAGNFYFSLTNDVVVMKVDTSGTMTILAGTPGVSGFAGDGGPATAARLIFPRGLAFDASGNLLISDNSRIRKVDVVTGNISTIAGSGTCCTLNDGGPATSAWFSAVGIGTDASGNIFIADSNSLRIRRIDAATNIITTVAGTGNSCNYGIGTSPVSCGDGGAATSAKFPSVNNVDVGPNGNLYIVDTSFERVRMVDATTGIITTIAGTSLSGGLVLSGPGPSIRLSQPFAVITDASNNAYIADTGFCRIRKVDPAGNLTTLAFTSACPNGLDMDSAGQIYLAYSSGNRIWKTDGTTGTIMAGDGFFSFYGDGGPATSARLNTPQGVAMNGAGKIFISDTNNSRMRVVDTAGQISTLAIVGSARVAVENSGNLLSSQNGGCIIQRINATTGAATTVAGTGSCGFSGDGGPATSARIYGTFGVATDSAGNFYIADTNNHRIRKVDTSGIITTVAGNGAIGCPSCSPPAGTYTGDGGPATSAGLNFPYNVAVNSAGDIFIADTNNSVIRKVDAVTGIITTVIGNGSCGSTGDGLDAGSARVCFPRGLAFDASGNLYIADTSNSRLRRVDAVSGIISTITTVSNAWSVFPTTGGNLLYTQGGNSTNAKVLQIPVGSGSPDISLSSPSIVFPDQAANVTSAALTLTVTNNGTAWLYTGNITSNNTEFTRTNNCPSNIGPGESCTVSITFRPTTFGLRTGTLIINDNSANSPHLVSLSGVGLAAAVSMSATSLGFGNQAYFVASAPQMVTITNIGNSNLTISSVSVSSDYPTTNNCVGTPIAPGGTCTLNIAFKPQGLGTRNGSTFISNNALGGIPTIFLTGVGVNPSISYSPASLSFGNQLINTTSAAQTITATNTGIVDFAITSVSLSSGFLQTNDCNGLIPVGGSCSINISFKPTFAGSTTGFFQLIASITGGSLPFIQPTGRGIATTTASVFPSTPTYPGIGSVTVQVFSSFAATGGPAGTVTLTIDGTTQLAQTIALSGGSANVFNYNFTIPTPTAGAHSLNADYTPDPGAFFAASTGSGTMNVNKGSQTITFPTILNQNYGNPPIMLAATATSGLTVNYVVNSGPATVLGNVLTITGVGTVTVTASQPGDSNWNAATSVARSFVVSKGNQTITFDPLTDMTFGDAPFPLTATASSGLAVSYAATGNCTVSAGVVSVTGAGSCTITASQAGNSLWNAAANVAQAFNIAKFTPTISVTGGTFTYDGSGHPATGSVTGAGGANLGSPSFTYNGNAAAPVNAGSYAVIATFAGNANYNPASDNSASIVIEPASQIITFAALADKTYGDAPLALSASATSGLAATFTASGNCTVVSTAVTLTGAGSCTVTASQAGDSNWSAAAGVTRTFNIARATPDVSVTGGTFPFDGASHAASGTAVGAFGEDLGALSFTYNGGTTEPINGGTYTVVGSYAGNPNYNPASGNATITIQAVSQTIMFAPLAAKTYGDPAFTVAATASSGLAVSFAASGNCTISSGTVTITGAGSCTITASQAGNSNYNAAAGVMQPFTINKANAVVTVTGGTFNSDGNPHPATGSAVGVFGETLAALTFTYNGSPSVPVASGTYAVVGSFAGDSNYNPGNGTATIIIRNSTQTITFGPLAAKTYGDPAFSVGATASSGLTVSFSAAGNCTVTGATITITGAGNCAITASQPGDTTWQAAPDVIQSFAIAKAIPAFSNLTNATIIVGTSSVTASGKINAGALVPTGTVAITLNGVTQSAAINPADGTFSAVFATASLPASATGYSIAYSYASSANFNAGAGAGSLQVRYASGAACYGDLGHQILQPVNVDGSSVFKQKSTVPAKFRVCDANGNSVGTAGVVSGFNLIQTISGTVASTVNEPVDSTTPDAAFRWSASDQQWIFNISTKSLSANITYVYRITLNDGSYIDFRYGLK